MEGLDKLTKAELITKLEELANTDAAVAIADRDKAITERDAAYAAQGDLATKLTDLEVKLGNAISEEDKAELDRQLQDLTDRLAANELTKGDPRPVVKVNNEQHLIVAPKVLIDGQVLTAQQLVNRPDLLQRLYDSKSHVLKSVKAIEAEKAAAAAKKKKA